MRQRTLLVLLLTALSVTTANADPKEICTSVRQQFIQTYNQRDWNRLSALYANDAIVFSLTENELNSGADAVRTFVSRGGGATLQMGDHVAVQVAPNVVACSGYQTVLGANFKALYRFTLVLANVNGNWLISAQHSSALPKEVK